MSGPPEVALTAPPRPAPESTSLFLDIDGTLADFERRPEEVVATPRRSRLLAALATGLDGRLALISGRAMSDIDRITEGGVAAVSGVHGLERRRADGRLDCATPSSAIATARARLKDVTREHPGLVLEDKGLGLVLHYRTAPGLQGLADAAVATLADELGLALQGGNMMAEVRMPGRDKGDALRAFMAEAPFAGRQPVYVGDDRTDEDAFAAASALGGWGVLVGPPRPTAASYRLPDVEAVLGWLEGLAGVIVATAGPAVAG